jgi:hypothetical protein
MPCFAHRDASGKCNHTNRNYKFVNDIKADQEVGYRRNRRQRPRGKGKADKDKESKDGSDMDEDPAPKSAEKAEGGAGKGNPFKNTNKKGPFKIAPGGLMHLLVTVDKFTKWIKAKPIKKLDGSSTIKFFNEIITRYGVPHSIITDNGTNFASVAHPQSNGQVEKANGLILAGIKPRLVEPLERSAGCWVEELPSVL